MGPVRLLLKIVKSLRQFQSFQEKTKHLCLHQFTFNPPLVAAKGHFCALYDEIKEFEKGKIFTHKLDLVKVIESLIRISFVSISTLVLPMNNLQSCLGVGEILAVFGVQVNLENHSLVQ